MRTTRNSAVLGPPRTKRLNRCGRPAERDPLGEPQIAARLATRPALARHLDGELAGDGDPRVQPRRRLHGTGHPRVKAGPAVPRQATWARLRIRISRNPDECPLTKQAVAVELKQLPMLSTQARPLMPTKKLASSVLFLSTLTLPTHAQGTPINRLYGWKIGQGLYEATVMPPSEQLVLPSALRVEALAFDPGTATLYAIENSSPENSLFSVDVCSGIVTFIGTVAGYDEITAMTYDETNGQLYAGSQATFELLTVDPNTGTATPVGGMFGYGPINALAAPAADKGFLFASLGVGQNQLARLSKSTGSHSLTGLTGSSGLSALAFDRVTGTLYGTGTFQAQGGPFIAEVDTGTGMATPIGPTQIRYSAMVFVDDLGYGSTNYCSALPNSSGNSAVIASSGSTSVATNMFSLSAAGAPPNRFGLYFGGAESSSAPFGDGVRCAGGTTFRLNPPVLTDSMGQVARSLDLASPPAAGLIDADETWYFQFWFRDPMGPGGAGFNLTDGLRVCFAP